MLAGHLGLRPAEVRTATWGSVNGDTFTVGRARTKATARRTRTVAIPAATARELREWRLANGRPADDTQIIGPMTQNAMKLWGRRVLRLAGAAVGHPDVSLYTLRHSHASALHYAGFRLAEAARRMGHGAALHVETYMHVIDGVTDRHDGLDALIAAARAELALPPGYQTAAAPGR